MTVRIHPSTPSLIMLREKLKSSNAKFYEGTITLKGKERNYVLFISEGVFSIFINFKVYMCDDLAELKDFLIINLGLSVEDADLLNEIFTNEKLRFLLNPIEF
jgi:hypothetical protein